MNNLTIIGRLGAEPVVRTTKETIVARISLGVNHKKENVDLVMKALKKANRVDLIPYLIYNKK